MRSALGLWVIVLPDVTLKIRDLASTGHFALNIPLWIDYL